MPSDDLKNYATSDTDFYELLGITFETSQKDIDRAWRKTALKYHPDKVGTDPTAKEKFHLAQIGYDLLSDPVTKVLYDNTRTARLQRKRQNELFEGKRRQMKDDLEARERGVKRGRDEMEGDEERLQREIQRLAEDGRRRRKEREEALRKDLLRETRLFEQKPTEDSTTHPKNPANGALHSTVSELDRTIQIRWPQEGHDEALKEDDIKSLFSKFGRIESADILTPKMLRIGKKHKKQLVATCMIQYSSVVGAHAAVEDFKKQTGPEWSRFDSVFWAANKEPEFIRTDRQAADSTTSTSSTRHGVSPPPKPFSANSNGTTPTAMRPPTGTEKHDGLKKKPSFASFPSSIFNTPKSSPLNNKPFANIPSSHSPSLEEMTMIRLKNAEKKRLADEIRKQDEEAAAAAAAS